MISTISSNSVGPTPCRASRILASTYDRFDGWQLSTGWYVWPYGQYNYTGGTFQNREGQLPSGASYNEYDVYPRALGASRDAYRIVVDRSTKVTWFTPDHYVTFYKLS